MADLSRIRPRNWRITQMLQSKLQGASGSTRWQQALQPAGQVLLAGLAGEATEVEPVRVEHSVAEYTPFIIGGAALLAVILIASKK